MRPTRVRCQSVAEKLLLTHRESLVLLERARVRVSGARVVYDIADDGTAKTYNVPYANIACVLLGQGCSITTEAARLLAQESVSVAMTGSGGSPLLYGTLVNYRPTEHFRRAMTAWLNPDEGLRVAKLMAEARAARMKSKYASVCGVSEAADRFMLTVNAAASQEELLGHEGVYAKSCYAALSAAALPGFSRDPGKGGLASVEPLANSLIDHGNYLCYGIAGTVLWALGIPPQMSVLHGRTRAGGLIFDVADTFKDSIVLEPAFARAAAGGKSADKDFRSDVMAALDKEKILEKTFALLNNILPQERA